MKKKFLSTLVVKKVFVLVFYLVTTSGLVAFNTRPNNEQSHPGGSPDVNGTISSFIEATNDRNAGDDESSAINKSMPSLTNFEQVSQAVSEALNRVNIRQNEPIQTDMTDLAENYHDFSIEKYEAVQRGDRHYKYLKFDKYWTDDGMKVHAYVSIPDSGDGTYALEYVNEVLITLNEELHVDTSNVDSEEVNQMARDVNEIGRFTCIKFLRLVWAIFSDEESDAKGLFPQVYQIQVVDAGDLARQVEGGADLFDPYNLNVTRPSLLKYANISNYNPADKVDMFDKKVVVFFRPTDKKAYAMDNGHVGVARLEAQYDGSGEFVEFIVSYLEVDGKTGQSFFNHQISMGDFRTHLYFNTTSTDPSSRQIIGWYINR